MESESQIPLLLEHLLKFGALYGIGFSFLFIFLLLRMLSRQQQQLLLLQTALQELKGPAAPGTELAPADGDSTATATAVVDKGDEAETPGGDASIADTMNARVSGDDSKTPPPVPEASIVGAEAKSESTAVSAGEPALSITATVGTTASIAAKEIPTEPSVQALPVEVTQAAARERLASAETILDNLEAEASTLELNRKLALLQVEVSALKGNDLLDQPSRHLERILQFQNRLDEFITGKHAEGKVVDDPTNFALDEVRRLEKVIEGISDCVAEHLQVGAAVEEKSTLSWSGPSPDQNSSQTDSSAKEKSGFELGFTPQVDRLENVVGSIGGFVEQQLQIGNAVVDPETHSLTRAKLEQIAKDSKAAAGRLAERQHQLSAGFLNRDLSVVNGQVDVEPDLVGFCRHRKPDSPLMDPRRPELCQFANGEGPLHSQVTDHLEIVQQNCDSLLDQHREQEQKVNDAETLANEGKFEEAEKLLNQVNPAFTDLEPQKVQEQIDSWRRKLADLEEHYDLLKNDLETPWERPFAQPWKVMSRERRLLKRASRFEDRLEAFRVDVNTSENTEFVEEGSRLYHRLASRLNDLATTFTRHSTDAKISTFLHFALILECVGGTAFADPEAMPIIFWTVGLLGCAFGVQLLHRALLNRTTVNFRMESNGRTLDEKEIACIFLNKKRYSSGDRIVPGTYQLTLDSNIFEPVAQRIRVSYGRKTDLGTIPVRLCRDTYVNSLEMKFVPVSGTMVMFSVWLTRVKDFRAYVRDRKLNWKKPRFKQDDVHPAVNVNWDDAREFCRWLTERERRGKRIGHRDEYRLPTDLEWSAAVELTNELGKTPGERSGLVPDRYPFGDKWPPSRNSANLDPSLNTDPYDFTSKVGKFPANRQGLFDLSGNVWEWCDDLYDPKAKNRVLRGGSWHTPSEEMCRSSFRLSDSPGHRLDIIGFRCVLEVRNPSPLFRPQLNQSGDQTAAE